LATPAEENIAEAGTSTPVTRHHGRTTGPVLMDIQEPVIEMVAPTGRVTVESENTPGRGLGIIEEVATESEVPPEPMTEATAEIVKEIETPSESAPEQGHITIPKPPSSSVIGVSQAADTIAPIEPEVVTDLASSPVWEERT